MKNRAFQKGIKQTPCEALFGIRMRLDLKTSNLPVVYVEQLERLEGKSTYLLGNVLINYIQFRSI